MGENNYTHREKVSGGINNKKYLLMESFHDEVASPPQVIFLDLRTTNRKVENTSSSRPKLEGGSPSLNGSVLMIIIIIRYDHCSWASPSGIILMGGYNSRKTTEKIQENGTSTVSFALKYST